MKGMIIIMTLDMINIGQNAIVRELVNDDKMKRRLLDMGLIEGTRIECVAKSPWGDPKAFDLRGAIIALREEDSRNIVVECGD